MMMIKMAMMWVRIMMAMSHASLMMSPLVKTHDEYYERREEEEEWEFGSSS